MVRATGGDGMTPTPPPVPVHLATDAALARLMASWPAPVRGGAPLLGVAGRRWVRQREREKEKR